MDSLMGHNSLSMLIEYNIREDSAKPAALSSLKSFGDVFAHKNKKKCT